jgi:hypothetical protein
VRLRFFQGYRCCSHLANHDTRRAAGQLGCLSQRYAGGQSARVLTTVSPAPHGGWDVECMACWAKAVACARGLEVQEVFPKQRPRPSPWPLQKAVDGSVELLL